MAQVNQSQVNQVTKDLQYYILHPSEVKNLPPEEQDRLANELEDLNAQEQARVAENIKKANLPPSQTQEVLGAIAAPLALVGGLKGGEYAFDALKGIMSGASEASTASPIGTSGIGPVLSPETYGSSLSTAAAPAAAPGAEVAAGVPDAPNILGGASAEAPQAGGFLSTAAPYLGAASAAAGAYGLGTNLMDNRKDAKGGALSGAALGGGLAGAAPLVGLAPLGPLGIGIGLLAGGAIGGGLGGLIGGNKDKDQLSRDAVRKRLVDSGALGKDYQIGFSNGSSFDIGKDGDAMLQNADGGQRRYFDADFSNAGTGDIVGLIQPLAAIIAGPEGKQKDDFTGYLVNAIQQSGMDPKVAAQELYKKFGFDKGSAWASIDQMQIDPNLGHAYRNGLNTVWGGGAPARQSQSMQQPQPMQMGGAPAPGGMSQSMPTARTNIPVGNRPMSPSPTTPSVKPQSKGSVVAQALTRLNPPSASSLMGLQRKPVDKEKKATVQKVSKVLGALGR